MWGAGDMGTWGGGKMGTWGGGPWGGGDTGTWGCGDTGTLDTYRWHSPACRMSSSLPRALRLSSCSVALKTSRSRWHCRVLQGETREAQNRLAPRGERLCLLSPEGPPCVRVSGLRFITNARAPGLREDCDAFPAKLWTRKSGSGVLLGPGPHAHGPAVPCTNHETVGGHWSLLAHAYGDQNT